MPSLSKPGIYRFKVAGNDEELANITIQKKLDWLPGC